MFPMETGFMFLCPVSVGNTNSVSARNITRNRSSGSKNVSYRNRTHVSNGSRFGNRSPVSSPVSNSETGLRKLPLLFEEFFQLEKFFNPRSVCDIFFFFFQLKHICVIQSYLISKQVTNSLETFDFRSSSCQY